MSSIRTHGVTCFAALALACAPGRIDDQEAAPEQQAIINGQADLDDAACVLIDLGGGLCSGTIIAKNGATAFVLTAGHCFDQAAPVSTMAVGQGQEPYTAAEAIYPVLEYHVHPKYQGPGAYDIAVVTIGDAANAPVIPMATPAEDTLAIGTPLEFVGYGKTESSSTGKRLTVNGVIKNTPATLEPAIGQLVFEYDQTPPIGGPCQGDSGGPAFAQLAGGKRVVGVTSFGDASCTVYGVSARASAYYESFVLPILGGTAAPSCSGCIDSVVAGACASAWSACDTPGKPCNDFLSCFDSCGAGDGACQKACIDNNPQGVADYQAFDACACGNCASPCASECASKPTTSNQSCEACIGDNSTTTCGAQLGACNANPDCVAFDNCVATAVTDADVQACAQQHAAGAQQYGDYVGCICSSACPTECSAECGSQTANCGFSTVGLGAACDGCWKKACCADGAACAADAACLACATDPNCSSDPKMLAWAECIANQCPAECALGTGGAGGGGGGAGVGGPAPPPNSARSSSGCSSAPEGSPGSPWAFALLAIAGLALRRRSPR